jgi:penicillin-binding protein 1A
VPETVRVDQPVSIKGWKPENYSRRYEGPVTLQTAFALSLNTISAQLTAEVGPSAVAATAHRLGIRSRLLATPSIALGTSEVTPLEMTAAFVPFSNGGRGIIPHVIDRIMTANGDILYERKGSGPGQIIDPRDVGMMNAMMAETVRNGTGKRAQIAGWPVGGKTGTSQDFRDAWFVGYTGVLTAGVWFGNDSGKPTKKASGSNMPAVAWNRFMTAALKGVKPVDLPGNYRFRDPGNFLPQPPALVGEDGAPIVLAPDEANRDRVAEMIARGWLDDPPSEGGSVGFGDAAPHERNFLQRLFGG